jgi:diguanylate cyclase (GGDEF)-like protein
MEKPSMAALAVVLAAFCRTSESAVPMRFERFGLDDGLSQQAVLAIAQDASGFIWLGTEDGLNRFDGFTFQHGARGAARSEGLSNLFVTHIEAAAAGALWIATDGRGVLARDPRGGDFAGLPPGIAGDVGLGSVRAVELDARGRVWIGTREAGVAVYDPQQRTLVRYRHSQSDAASLSADAIYSLLIVDGGTWVGTDGGLDYIRDGSSAAVRRYSLGSAAWSAAGSRAVRALLQDHVGVLWIGTDRGLIRLEPTTGRQTLFRADARDPAALPADEIQALLEDSARRLWVGTTAGLALYDPRRRGFDTYRHDPADPASLPDDRIVSLFEDRGGLLWVGTQLAGVAKWNPRSWSFGHRRERGAPAMANHITSFTEDRTGTMWIGTFGAGLRTVDHAGRAVSSWRGSFSERAIADSGLDDGEIMALLADRTGAVWIGTMSAGLRRIAADRRRTDVYRHDPARPNSLPADGVMSLLEDSAGRIWVGTYGGGLSQFEPRTNEFHRAASLPGAPAPLTEGRITALVEDRDGRIWAATDGAGLHVVIPSTGETRQWLHDPGNVHGISADTVYALHVDAGGTLWIGTHGGGLDRAAPMTRDLSQLGFAHYDEAHGLPDNTVYGILSDDSGCLWLSTGHGITALSPHDGAVRSFHRSHGLQGEEFNFGAAFRSSAGQLYFGGTNGYNVFTPRLLQLQTHPPPVALTGVSILNQPLQSTSPYEQLGKLQLGYRDQVVTFDFAALDFAAPRENRYRYRLQGFDAGWVDAGARRSATYTRLAGGNYTFRVQAATPDSSWSKAGLALSLQVAAPPWKRTWAYATYVAVLCLSLLAFWSAWRRKRAREERYRTQLEVEVRDRTQELAERNTELEEANRKLEEASLTDPLTGLANRRALLQALPGLAAACSGQRRAAHVGQIVLMIIDLDCFKPINDRHGHEAGDGVLKQVAAILKDCVRNGDLAVRWGGDEFVVVYASASLDDGAVLAERIRMRIAKHRFRVGNGEIARTSASIGFVCYPFVRGAPHLLTYEQALNVADSALLRAKEQRNSWVGWGGTPATPNITGLFSALDSNPRAILERGALEQLSSPYRPDETVDELIRGLRR